MGAHIEHVVSESMLRLMCRYFNGHQALQHSCVFDEQSEATALRRRLHECQQQQQLLDKLDEVNYQSALIIALNVCKGTALA